MWIWAQYWTKSRASSHRWGTAGDLRTFCFCPKSTQHCKICKPVTTGSCPASKSFSPVSVGRSTPNACGRSACICGWRYNNGGPISSLFCGPWPGIMWSRPRFIACCDGIGDCQQPLRHPAAQRHYPTHPQPQPQTQPYPHLTFHHHQSLFRSTSCA